jgi:formylglycine-generating enzyme required for sulfatase activity
VLRRAYETDPDPGLHSAVDWLLRRWGKGEILDETDRELAAKGPDPGRRWYVNRQGQTFAVLATPGEVRIGTPRREPIREWGEYQQFVHIPRAFAIATKEVTYRQFDRFQAAKPESVDRSDWDGPILRTKWFWAVAYCNWLDDQEHVPDDQRCYLRNSRGQFAPGMRMAPDFLKRTGHRLPTEAEWEYACRAGATTSRYYGSDDDMLGYYATFQGNADERASKVGVRKPNDFGLFDTLGNVWEWCQDPQQPHEIEASWRVREDVEKEAKDGVVDLKPNRAMRGGAFDTVTRSIRAARRFSFRPDEVSPLVSLRVARTVYLDRPPWGKPAAAGR